MENYDSQLIDKLLDASKLFWTEYQETDNRYQHQFMMVKELDRQTMLEMYEVLGEMTPEQLERYTEIKHLRKASDFDLTILTE